MPRLPKTDHLPSLALLRSAAAWSLVVALHGAALANPAAAQPITAVQIADLAEMDALLRSDQAPEDPQQPLGPPAPQPVSDVPAEDVYGPQPEETELVNEGDLAPDSPLPARTYASFGEDVKAIKWEAAAVFGYYTAINAPKLFQNPRWPTFQTEGWFGRNTNNLGVDKLAHAYSTYVVSELLHSRLRRKTGDAPGIELTSALLASGVMMWAEAFDSIEQTSGWSWEDVAFNSMGAGFSVVRNAVPGLDRKLDFRLMIEPNENIYTLNGKEHFRQQRYMFALKPSGFEGLNKTPLRFLEFHLGYRADDFLNEDRAAGLTPKRHIFAGIGINFRELLFKNPRTRAGRAAGDVLDYFQLPYTALHLDLTE